jgi:tetratricopeptide (TPR) repeat protein
MLHQMRNEFEVCRELIHDRLDLFQAHPGLCNKNRMGAVYMQLANIETNCLRFEEAIQAAEQARDSFPPSKPSYLKASTILIFATLYQGQLDWARAIIDELQSYQGQPNAQRIMPVVSHLEACWQYMKGDLRAAHLLLAEDRVLVQDKSGWNVGQRILEIMILVELGDLDVAEARVETLRKHIARHGANPRDELIFRVLYQASRCVFDFTQLGDKFNCAMEELAKHDWVSMNHEVIRFETWIRCQQEGRPYLELMPTELAAIRMRS